MTETQRQTALRQVEAIRRSDEADRMDYDTVHGLADACGFDALLDRLAEIPGDGDEYRALLRRAGDRCGGDDDAQLARWVARVEHPRRSVFDVYADAGREQIIFGEVFGATTVTRFAADPVARGDPLDADTARRLIEAEYLPPDLAQNYGPPAERLVEAAAEIDTETTAATSGGVVGYLVPRTRADARVSLVGVVATPAADADEIPPTDRDRVAAALSPVTDEHPPDEATHGADLCRVWWD